MYEDGFYTFPGTEGKLLMMFRSDGGKTIWIRVFVNVDSAGEVLMDDISADEISIIKGATANGRGTFLPDAKREDLEQTAYLKYVLQPE